MIVALVAIDRPGGWPRRHRMERLDEASGPWRGSAFGKARQAGDHGYQDNGSGQRFHPTRSFGARVSPLANNKAGKNK